ncbi:uncharacterized protein LOC112693876 [Sipha flava]|nr:uncharacterized protein LOC112693876 [Sipha flava]
MKSLTAVSVAFSLVLAISHCAPGRLGTVDQYRPAFDLENSDNHSDPDDYDSYYNPDPWTESEDAGGVVLVSEKPQDHTRIPTEEPVTSSSRPEAEYQTPEEHVDDAYTTTNEPTTNAPTTQVV